MASASEALDVGKADDAVEVATTTGNDGEPSVAAGKRMMRLPEAEVKWVLSRKSEYLSSTSKRLVSPEFAALSKELSDSFVEYQEWVCREFEANNGVVMVDEDEYLAHRAENNQWLKEFKVMFDSIDFSGWAFSDCPSDFFKDEDDSEEEDEDDEEEESN